MHVINRALEHLAFMQWEKNISNRKLLGKCMREYLLMDDQHKICCYVY